MSRPCTPIPPSSVAIATPECVSNGARQSPYVLATLAVASSAILRVIYAAAGRLSDRAQTVTDGNGVRREPCSVSGREKTREKGPTVCASTVEHGHNDGSTVPTRERQLYRARCRRRLAVAPGTNETAAAPRATERAKPSMKDGNRSALRTRERQRRQRLDSVPPGYGHTADPTVSPQRQPPPPPPTRATRTATSLSPVTPTLSRSTQ
jgi:hypothetical protein